MRSLSDVRNSRVGFFIRALVVAAYKPTRTVDRRVWVRSA